ncbi:fetuin-B [Rhineura floridana]|uniref:fetuin-B n=1 Tax=Rhineura floridana TaxID=261503 RepID=UPI002AC84ED3|nr:fetuin-B [Rhineura floridana]
MDLLISFLIGIQVLCSLAGHPFRPPVPPPPIQLLSPGCNNSIVKTAADQALDRINSHRREGYVLGLQRIFDARELPQGAAGSVFYLTLDVLETTCHVLSRKLWKDCEFRTRHETVYGQCKTAVYASKNGDISHLHNYDCVLRPLSSSAIVKVCPDCPVPGDPSEARFLETAAESLVKFNSESNHAHYFAILNVTKARSQWVVGPSNFVEYAIQETSCTKTNPVPDISKCPLLPPEIAETGLCKGSVVNSQIENQKFVTVQCDLYPPEPLVTDEQNPEPAPTSGHEGHHGDDESHEDEHHKKGYGHRHHHHRHRHRPHHRGHHRHHSKHYGHHRHHGNHSQEHPAPPDMKETVGRVIVLPPSNTHVSLHSLPEIESEQLDGKPVPPVVQVTPPNTKPSLPDIHGSPKEGDTQSGKPSLTKPARPGIPPFPVGFSGSDTCPGDSTVTIFGLELPGRPLVNLPKKSQTLVNVEH